MPGQVHCGLRLKEPAEFAGEMALGAVRPAQEGRPGALQGDDVACGQDGLLPVRQASGSPEQAGGGDGPRIGRPSVPRAADPEL
jgi:hypothetical protein